MKPESRALTALRLPLAGLLILAVCLASSHSYLYSDELSAVSLVVGTLGVSAWALGALLLLQWLASIAQRPARSALARLYEWVLWVALTAGLFVWVSSWVGFFMVGFFLSPAMLEFFLNDPVHVLVFLTPRELKAFGAAALLSIVIGLLLRSVLRRGQGLGRRSVLLGVTVSLLSSWAALDLYPRLMLSEDQARVYRGAVHFRSTPALAFLSGLVTGGATAAMPEVRLAPRRALADYASKNQGAGGRRPNVVLLVVESMRRDSLQVLGGTRKVMPKLDAMASRGLVFSRAYAQSNASHYALAAILSSVHPLWNPRHTTFHDHPFPKTTLPDFFKALGYRTAIFSSSNEKFADLAEYLSTPGLDVFFYPEVYEGPTIIAPQDTGVWRNILLGRLRKGVLDDRVTVQHFSEWAAAPSDQPFFAYLNFQASHFPYQLAFEMEKPFAPHELDFEASFASYPRDKAQVMRNRYDNSLRYIDDRIGDLAALLAQKGIADNTILVVMGDHGQEFFEHGGVTHAQWLYEEVVTIPLVFVGPASLVPTAVDDRPIQQVDIAPTLLGLMGLSDYPGFQGRDVLRSGRDPYDHKIFLVSQHLRTQYGLVWRQYKYIWDAQGDNRLYLLEKDPLERTNLLHSHPMVAAQYQSLLERWSSVQYYYYSQSRLFTQFFPPRHEQ